MHRQTCRQDFPPVPRRVDSSVYFSIFVRGGRGDSVGAPSKVAQNISSNINISVNANVIDSSLNKLYLVSSSLSKEIGAHLMALQTRFLASCGLRSAQHLCLWPPRALFTGSRTGIRTRWHGMVDVHDGCLAAEASGSDTCCCSAEIHDVEGLKHVHVKGRERYGFTRGDFDQQKPQNTCP